MQVGKLTINCPAVTGNQSYSCVDANGVPFVPKFLKIFGTQNTADGWIGHNRFGVGFVAANASRAMSFTSANSVGTTATGKRMAAVAFTLISGTGTVQVEASFVSFDLPGGFTLNWTTIASAGNTYQLHVLAIGGDEVSAFVGDKLWGSSTGIIANPGCGYSPDFVMTMGGDTGAALPYGTTFAAFSLGMFTRFGSAAIALKDSHNVSPSAVGQWQTTDAMIGITGQAAEPFEEMKADWSSMDADGYSCNLLTANNDRYAYAALKGGRYWVGQDTQAVSAGVQSKRGIGFTPAGAALFGCNAVANASKDYTQCNLVLGAADGVNEGCTWNNSRDNLATTDNHQRSSTTKALAHCHESPSETVDAEADWIPQPDGYDMNWTTADANAREFNVALFGSDTGARKSFAAIPFIPFGKAA